MTSVPVTVNSGATVQVVAARLDGCTGSAISSINAKLMSTAKKYVADVGSDPGNTLDVKPSLVVSTKAIAGVRYDVTEYTGGAHPEALVALDVYDLASGHQFTLADAFRSGTRYLDALSAQSRQLLAAQLGPDRDQSLIDEGTTPTAEHFALWYPARDGMVIVFALNQVGPTVIGTPQVTVPYSALASLIDPEGPLAPFAA
jgi:hypothetical protein